MSDKGHAEQKDIKILQFNQMKGVHEGRIATRSWKKEDGTTILHAESMKGTPLPGEYLVAIVEGNKIIEWVPASMLDMRSTAVVEQQTESKVQKWSLEHKKNMVSQFGTSKSKRKLNQMMNNIIQ